MLATLALVVASSGTAIAAESLSHGDKTVAWPNGKTAVRAEVTRHATIALGMPRRPDGTLLPHLGR
jgi:hypothetical protein